METSPAAAPFAELIVRNSRKQGKRRPLKGPITIIGSTQGCDVRLDVPNVRPIHCMIAMGADGPHLRSWGADDTFVNGALTLTRLLRDGDLLKVGAFEFEVRWTVPLAEAVDPAPMMSQEPAAVAAPAEPAPPVPMPTDEKIRRLEELQRQLGEARANFRREREEHDADLALQLRALAEARQEVEQREDEGTRLRSRLHHLRTRFIKRWKKHWSLQRQRLQAEQDRLVEERSRLDNERSAFEQEREQFHAHEQVEHRRIEHGWEQLRAAERRARNEQNRQEAAIDERARAVAEAAARLHSEQAVVQSERMHLERHSADLRIEADGMESRVVNLRAVLLQLDEERACHGWPGDAAESQPTESSSDPGPTDLDDRQIALEKLADELADQRIDLLQQVDRLAVAREAWRGEESRLLGEMAELGEQLRRREEAIAENEIATTFEREQLDREAAALKQLREQLEVRQARQNSIEAEWRSELGRRHTDLEQRSRDFLRREKALKEMCRRWSERRRREVVEVRDEHRRCERLRHAWAEQMASCERREQALEDIKVELAARSLALEKARHSLLGTGATAMLAAKKLQRLDRHVRSSLVRPEARIQQGRQALEIERAELLKLLGHANEKIEEAEVKQRQGADRFTEVERREYVTVQQALTLTETKIVWQTLTEMLERERNELRDEVDRLAAMLIERDEPEDVPLARAA